MYSAQLRQKDGGNRSGTKVEVVELDVGEQRRPTHSVTDILYTNTWQALEDATLPDGVSVDPKGEGRPEES